CRTALLASFPRPLSAVSPTCVRPIVLFFTDPSTTDIYTLSLHDALPISTFNRSPRRCCARATSPARPKTGPEFRWRSPPSTSARSEEHTSELQSHLNLVCRLLLEKKNNKKKQVIHEVIISDRNYLNTRHA